MELIWTAKSNEVTAWDEANNRIAFIEMYHKGDIEIEDKARIKAYLKSLTDQK